MGFKQYTVWESKLCMKYKTDTIHANNRQMYISHVWKIGRDTFTFVTWQNIFLRSDISFTE